MKIKTVVLNSQRNVTLTCYLHEQSKEYKYIKQRPAIIILPGGGYQFCSDNEADPIALEYLSIGYNAFVLRYSVKEHAVWPNPINDYEQAYEYIQENSLNWKINPNKIAVIGFSAGGHLAACAATLSKYRPASVLLGYPAILDEISKTICSDAPSPALHVDANTPPCFIFATRNDNVVPADNSLAMMMALYQKGISFESHIYSYGPHGFGNAESSLHNQDKHHVSSKVRNWVDDSKIWLQETIGNLTGECAFMPVLKSIVPGDYSPFLSINASARKVLSHPEGYAIVKEYLKDSIAIEAVDNLLLSFKSSGIILREILNHFCEDINNSTELETKLNSIVAD